jgi:ELWxxDGT repeat protein
LWQYDGVSVTMVADINPSTSSTPKHLTAFGHTLYFQATDGPHGKELWQYNGITATMVADICTGGDSSPGGSDTPSGLVVYGDGLYFQATDGTNVHDVELWKLFYHSVYLSSVLRNH